MHFESEFSLFTHMSHSQKLQPLTICSSRSVEGGLSTNMRCVQRPSSSSEVALNDLAQRLACVQLNYLSSTIHEEQTSSSTSTSSSPTLSRRITPNILTVPMVPPKQGRRARAVDHCPLCKKNGEMQVFYRGHRLRDEFNIVTCPVLRAYICHFCGATGDVAHTISYCPYRPSNAPPSAARLNRRNATGKQRRRSR